MQCKFGRRCIQIFEGEVFGNTYSLKSLIFWKYVISEVSDLLIVFGNTYSLKFPIYLFFWKYVFSEVSDIPIFFGNTYSLKFLIYLFFLEIRILWNS